MPRHIFLGLNEVAGYYAGLKRGFDELGIRATFVDLSGDPYRYRGPTLYGRLKAPAKTRAAAAAPRSVPRRLMWWAVATLHRTARRSVKLAWFLWAIVRCDAFILAGVETFLSGHDLRLLRLLGKRTIVVFTGTDHRPPYLNGSALARLTPRGVPAILEETRQVRARVRQAERFADVIVALPSSAQFHIRPFANFLAVGIPVAEVDEPAHRDPDGPVRVLHSPSSPLVKGTPRIREIIRSLTDRGHDIDYVEIMGRPNADVHRAIAVSDVVVDELFSDSPLAVFAAEAAAHGKPAVVGGYYAEEVNELDPDLVPPSAFVAPDHLETRLEQLITDPAGRQALGEQARDFVRRNWGSRQVADRFRRMLDGDVPPAWLSQPSASGYVRGYGLSEAQLATAIRSLVAAGGVRALRLEHRPDLEERLLALADRA